MRQNNRGYKDVRRLFSGKDACIYDEDGNMLATVDAFQAQVNYQNANYNPLGDTQGHRHILSYEVTLVITSCIVESDKFLSDMYSMFKTGVPVWWTFAHDIRGWNGEHERVIYRDCVPDGQIDLQNIQVGELLKRTLNLFVNQPPELQKILDIADTKTIYDYDGNSYKNVPGGYTNVGG